MYLLDTHILLWWFADPSLLSEEAYKRIADSENRIWISVVSLWEMAIKEKLGKLEIPSDPTHEIEKEGFHLLDIRAKHALAVRHLPNHHQDPFDHLLIAQSKVEKLTLISRDAQFRKYGISLVKG